MAQEQLLAILADGAFHSGEELGERLGVSRAAIWKQLKKLDELGLRVHSVKGRGYRIPDGLDLLDLPTLKAQLDERARALLGPIRLELQTASTNRAALAAAQRGDAHGALFLAERQTAGRGRRGRQWVSPFGCNLYFSLVWTFAGGAAALEGLSLVVGCALRRGLADAGVEGVMLKWPNDLLHGDRKLAGILLEMTGDASGLCQVVIGAGINVRMPEEMAAAIDQPWTDIARVAPACGDRNRLLARVLDRLVEALTDFARQGFAPFRAEWQDCNAHRDRPVTLRTESLGVTGICRGVDASGALLLETDAGVRAFHGGELSLRGAE